MHRSIFLSLAAAAVQLIGISLLLAGCALLKHSTDEQPFERGDAVWILNASHIERTADAKKTVDANGNITLPVLGAVHVQGLTPQQVERLLEDLYVRRGVYRRCDLTVERCALRP